MTHHLQDSSFPPSLEQAHQTSESILIQEIPIDRITQENPYRHRVKPFDPLKDPVDEELLDSIRANGVLVPIEVLMLPGEPGQPANYMIIFGHRRVAAVRMLGIKTIPAWAVPGKYETLYRLFVENSGRLPLSRYEKALELEAYHRQHPDLNNDQFAEKIGVNVRTYNNLMQALRKSTPVLRMLLHSDAVELRAVLVLQQLFADLSEDDQLELARILVKGISRDQAKELLALTKPDTPAVNAAKWVLYKSLLEEQIPDPLTSGAQNGPETATSDIANTGDEPGHGTQEETQAAVPSKDGLNREEAVEYLRNLTGVSEQTVLHLFDEAGGLNVTLEMLTVACLAIRNGADAKYAILNSMDIMGQPKNKKIAGLFRRLIRDLPEARSAVLKARAEDQEFLKRYFSLG